MHVAHHHGCQKVNPTDFVGEYYIMTCNTHFTLWVSHTCSHTLSQWEAKKSFVNWPKAKGHQGDLVPSHCLGWLRLAGILVKHTPTHTCYSCQHTDKHSERVCLHHRKETDKRHHPPACVSSCMPLPHSPSALMFIYCPKNMLTLDKTSICVLHPRHDCSDCTYHK